MMASPSTSEKAMDLPFLEQHLQSLRGDAQVSGNPVEIELRVDEVLVHVSVCSP